MREEKKELAVSHPLLGMIGRGMADKVRAGATIGFLVNVVDHDGTMGIEMQGSGEAMETAFIIRQILEAQPEVNAIFRMMQKIKNDPDGAGKEMLNADRQLKDLMDSLDNES